MTLSKLMFVLFVLHGLVVIHIRHLLCRNISLALFVYVCVIVVIFSQEEELALAAQQVLEAERALAEALAAAAAVKPVAEAVAPVPVRRSARSLRGIINNTFIARENITVIRQIRFLSV